MGAQCAASLATSIGVDFLALFAALVFGDGGDIEYANWTAAAVTYCIGNTVVPTLVSWGTAKMLGADASLWKAAIGAGLGTFVGFQMFTGKGVGAWGSSGFLSGVRWGIVLTGPSVGAVVGCNL